MKRILLFVSAIVLASGAVIADFSPVLALSEVDRYCVGRYCPNWSNEKSACSASGGATSGGTLPASVPAPFNAIFSEAAANGPHSNGKPSGAADPLLLASIYYIENRGWREPPPPYGNGRPWAVSPAGAMGPFQFLPTTWTGHGRDIDGKNGADILDFKEAAYGAADFIFDIGGKAGIPFGDPAKPRSVKPSVMNTFVSYNAGPYGGDNLSSEARQYVDLGVSIYNKLKSGSTSAKPETTATSAAEESTPGCGNNAGGGAGVSGDGFVFPLKTSKSKMTKNAYWSPKCKNPVSQMGSLGSTAKRGDLCHHDYLAADIQAPAGTPVLSPRPGRVIRTSLEPVTASCFGSSVTIYSDKALGGDGNTYYETHLGMAHSVREGQKVTAGQQVSTVGASGSCFEPHLHIDISPVQAGFARNSQIGTAGPLLDPQPALVAAYENLPEN